MRGIATVLSCAALLACDRAAAAIASAPQQPSSHAGIVGG
jgi:hypothetical protein